MTKRIALKLHCFYGVLSIFCLNLPMYLLETHVVGQSECRKKERDGFRFVLVNVYALVNS